MIGVYLTKTGQLRAISGSVDERNMLRLSLVYERVYIISVGSEVAARISYDKASGVIESISPDKAGDAVEVIIA